MGSVGSPRNNITNLGLYKLLSYPTRFGLLNDGAFKVYSSQINYRLSGRDTILSGKVQKEGNVVEYKIEPEIDTKSLQDILLDAEDIIDIDTNTVESAELDVQSLYYLYQRNKEKTLLHFRSVLFKLKDSKDYMTVPLRIHLYLIMNAYILGLVPESFDLYFSAYIRNGKLEASKRNTISLSDILNDIPELICDISNAIQNFN